MFQIVKNFLRWFFSLRLLHFSTLVNESPLRAKVALPE